MLCDWCYTYTTIYLDISSSGTVYHFIQGQFHNLGFISKCPSYATHTTQQGWVHLPFRLPGSRLASRLTSLHWKLMTYCTGSSPNEKLWAAHLFLTHNTKRGWHFIYLFIFFQWTINLLKPLVRFKHWLYATQSVHTAD